MNKPFSCYSRLFFCALHCFCGVVQWLSGRVLDFRPRGIGFEPHRHHCLVFLEQDTFILAQPRKTRPCLTERLLMGRKESNQTKLLYFGDLYNKQYGPRSDCSGYIINVSFLDKFRLLTISKLFACWIIFHDLVVIC